MASFELTGSGDIKKFHIIKKGNMSLTGSGDIKGTCFLDANINSTKIGSGKIKIKHI